MSSYLLGLPTDSSPQNKSLYAPLAEVDPEVQNIIDKETWRQFSGLELIASEVRAFHLHPGERGANAGHRT